MGLSIKNTALEASIRELAAKRGVSLTDAVDQAVRAALDSEAKAKALKLEARRARIDQIVKRVAARSRLDPRPLAEIMDELYDENGLPV